MKGKVERVHSPWRSFAEHFTLPAQGETPSAAPWQWFAGLFVLILLPALAWVWLQKPMYQSQAILHFAYPQQTHQPSGLLLPSVPLEQLTINQQRLTASGLLQQLSESLLAEDGIELAPRQLADMLEARAETTSRIINLSAKGTEPVHLAPVLNRWIDLFMAQQQDESRLTSGADIALVEQKLASIELRVAEHTARMQDFANEQDIVSLQRDENPALSRSRNLSSSLDDAKAEQAEAEALQQSAQVALERGEVLIHSDDVPSINRLEAQLASLKGELDGLSIRYTEAYMRRDPQIVDKINRREALAEQRIELLAESQRRYLQQADLAVIAARNKVTLLQEQMAQLEQQAQSFSQTLAEYQRMEDERSNLEQRAQIARNELIEKQIEKPFVARISVMEQPYTPTHPVGPAYWLQSALAVLIALAGSLAALLVYRFVLAPRPQPQYSHFTLVQEGQPRDVVTLPQQQQMLDSAAATTALPQPPPQLAHARPVLTPAQCQLLFDNANISGKRCLVLLLNGVAADELPTIGFSDIDAVACQLKIDGSSARTIRLPETAKGLFRPGLKAQNSLWPHPMKVADFDQLLINAGHDADLAETEKLSCEVLRHTCLHYWVTQGMRLNEVELRAGHLHPQQLAQYRPLSPNHLITESSGSDWFYPLTVSLPTHS